MNRIKQAGLTLVELLIAVALSAVIIIGLTQVFLSNREAFNLSESMARVQENGRFAMNVITEAIRSSGNYGCIPWYSPEIDNIHRQVTNNEINSFNAVTTVTQEGAGVVNGINAPDQLDVLRIVGDPVPIQSIDYATNLITTDWAIDDVAENDLLLVSNCLVGDYIRAGANTAGTIIEDGTGNLREGLYDRADQENTVVKVERLSFSVDAEGDLNLTTNLGSPNAPPVTELVGGIENLQFRYGVDLDDNFVPDYIDDYANIPAADRANIIAIEVNLLVGSLVNDASVVNVVSEPQTFNFAGGVFQAPDRRLYRPFQTLVTIRNRVK
ncbi:PilW family protein [Reinekea marina]|uniref:PilW family protein n=1 Tax=Reinekea marina TaxID=1310421 RepID=A0ABV7WTT9_9GAMM|nr:PilW family protein [Reinekea marina]MDN3648268.1 PilW family protein [Reinekea marina]